MNPINKISYSLIELIDKYIHRKKILFFLKKIIKKPKYILDIGAHKGNYTDLFLHLNTNLKIILFEPNIYLYKKLLKKYKNNNNLKILNLGIGEKKTKKNFLINKNSDYVSSLSRINSKSKYLLIRNLILGSLSNKVEKKIINIQKLDNLNFLQNKKIDLIKIDVEGYEENVIDGAKLILKNTKIILIEFHNDDMYVNFNAKKIHNKLIKLGFKLDKKIKFPLMRWEDRIYLQKN